MTVTGIANLAVKVADLDAACAFYQAAGAEVRGRMFWNNGERADVYLGPVMLTLFTHAIYEDRVELPDEGFLHPALFTDDLDAELEGHTVVWGPAVVEGAFGTRRIAFVEAPGGIRLEFMEQIGPATQDDGRITVTRFQHVSVNTEGAALAEVVDFYRDVLGLADEERPDIPDVAGHWHKVGDQQLHLVDAPRSGTTIDPTGPHFCVGVADLDAAIEELEARGISYLRAVQGAGTVQIWFADPAGNTIELQQETYTT